MRYHSWASWAKLANSPSFHNEFTDTNNDDAGDSPNHNFSTEDTGTTLAGSNQQNTQTDVDSDFGVQNLEAVLGDDIELSQEAIDLFVIDHITPWWND